ncbi:MAG: substrate-binding domain-containing protein, partial [Coprobacillus sp.]
MKKVLSLLLSCAMLLCMGIALTGCGSDKKESTGGGEATVHVFYYSNADPYISSVRAVLDKQLEGAGIKFQNYDGNNNQTTQSEQIDTAITKGAKVLVVNLVN